MSRPPLSARSSPETIEAYASLHEGIPPWMVASATAWVKEFLFAANGWGLTGEVLEAEQHLRIALGWSGKNDAMRANFAGHQLLGLLTDHVLGLDLIDHCLGRCSRSDSRRRRMQAMLDASASAWTVGTGADGRPCLERRVDDATEALARAEMERSGKASQYLHAAWHGVYGRSQNPSAAYHDAIRAVEAAARPIVTPTDDLATLGKMISALKSGPATRWTTAIGDVDSVRQMMQTLWRAQHDRHGTDDETKPVTVSQKEAEAALHLAVTLVHWFRSGAIR